MTVRCHWNRSRRMLDMENPLREGKPGDSRRRAFLGIVPQVIRIANAHTVAGPRRACGTRRSRSLPSRSRFGGKRNVVREVAIGSSESRACRSMGRPCGRRRDGSVRNELQEPSLVANRPASPLGAVWSQPTCFAIDGGPVPSVSGSNQQRTLLNLSRSSARIAAVMRCLQWGTGTFTVHPPTAYMDSFGHRRAHRG